MTPRAVAFLAALAVTTALPGCSASTPRAVRAPIRSPQHPVTTPSAPAPTPSARRRPFTLAFGGDVHFEGAVRSRLAADPRSVFGDVAPVLRAADLAMVNLETAVTDRGTPAPKQYVFRAPRTAFTALRAAGIDVATNANNHGMDYGQVGLQDTLDAARAARFPLVGSGADEQAALAPYRRTLHGWRVAVIGATQVLDTSVAEAWTAGPGHPGLANAKRVDAVVRAVAQARRTSDVVVVYLHWGVELAACPSRAQRDLAQRLVDAGADVVVGSHAHVVLGTGMLGHSFVDYGLGNFLFYANGSGPTTLTSVVTLRMDGRRVVGVTRTPARLGGGRTSVLPGAAGEREVRRELALRGCTGLTAT